MRPHRTVFFEGTPKQPLVSPITIGNFLCKAPRLLIRVRRSDLHRRLGVVGAILAGIMLVLGPATAIIVDAERYTTSGQTPEFLAVQLTDILAFGTLAGTGLLLRLTIDRAGCVLQPELESVLAAPDRSLNGPIAPV